MARIFSIILTLALLSVSAFAEKESKDDEQYIGTNYKSMSLGGATGYISTPNANTGWESKWFSMDWGYHFVDSYFSTNPDFMSHIPKVMFQLFGLLELGMTIDFQTPGYHDMILPIKLRFYGKGQSAAAIGGNFQIINFDNKNPNITELAGQLYFVYTYSGSVFSWPAETSIVVGYTFRKSMLANIDFSMGFDLNIAPEYLKGYLHWITDFANYSYSIDPRSGVNNYDRGVLNTGFRIIFMQDKNFKLNLDILFLDLLDNNRGFSAGITMGVPFM